MKQAASNTDDWDRFTADLTPCLSDLDEDEFLIISDKKINYYVQFAAQGKFGMRIEAACNSFLEPHAVLTVEDYERMARLGWMRATNPPPTGSGEPEPDTGSPNFYIDADAPVDFAAMARLTVATFQGVYRIGHPGQLQYKAFAKDHTQIRFPTLRLKRERSS